LNAWSLNCITLRFFASHVLIMGELLLSSSGWAGIRYPPSKPPVVQNLAEVPATSKMYIIWNVSNMIAFGQKEHRAFNHFWPYLSFLLQWSIRRNVPLSSRL
jgi:hypothetical protein